MKEIFKKLLDKLHKPPTYVDTIILSLFTILITLQPFYPEGKINLFELGLYLPGIDAVLRGDVLYRDVFHLRGPLEIYLPAAMMKIFGVHLNILYLYFYVGTISTMILFVLTAREFFKTKYIYYLFTIVFTARTFPRVVYHIWGGFRYAFGILSIYCAIRFFKTNRKLWIFLSGVAASLGILISVEIGLCAIFGLLLSFVFGLIFKIFDLKDAIKSISIFLLGACIVSIPYLIYLALNNALIPFWDSMYIVVTNMEKVIDQHFVSTYPRTFIQSVLAMINPAAKNFRHLTPGYLYLIVLFVLLKRVHTKKFSVVDINLLCLGGYGIFMYVTCFRSLWASQFEMALQPEKILLFYVLEQVYFYLLTIKDEIINYSKTSITAGIHIRFPRAKVYGIYFMLFLFCGSSLGYSIDRFNKRFIFFKIVRDKLMGKNIDYLRPLAGEKSRALKIERAEGVITTESQANDIEQVVSFLQDNTNADEVVFMHSEMGIYNFFADRKFLGRFPLYTFAWFDEGWFDEFCKDFLEVKPKFVVIRKDFPTNWKEVYLAKKNNVIKYEKLLKMISDNYHFVKETENAKIYQIN